MKCEQEMCPFWSGEGCACSVLGIEPCIAPPGNLCTETGCWDTDRCVVRTGCGCGHSTYDHSASNVVGCYWCECGVDA